MLNVWETKGLVSVIIPTYNRKNTILRALDSVLKQTYKDIEVIIVDDGSTDDTDLLLRSVNDERIRTIKNKERRGAAYSRNIGIKHSHGEYIAFQDSDDEWYEDKLTKQLEYMVSGDYAAVFCPYIQVRNNGTKRLVPSKESFDYERMENNLSSYLKKQNVIGTPALMIRKIAVDNVGVFDETLRKLEDYEYAIRLVEKCKIGFVSEPLVNAYVQPGGITNNTELDWNAYIGILNKHKDFLDKDQFVTMFCRSGLLVKNDTIDDERIEEIHDLFGLPGIQRILEYYHNNYIDYKEFAQEAYLQFEKEIDSDEFIIYGAGVNARRLFERLKTKQRTPRFFVVTDKKGNPSSIEGISVVSIDDVNDLEARIVIAVAEKNRADIFRDLKNRGFMNCVVFCA